MPIDPTAALAVNMAAAPKTMAFFLGSGDYLAVQVTVLLRIATGARGIPIGVGPAYWWGFVISATAQQDTSLAKKEHLPVQSRQLQFKQHRRDTLRYEKRQDVSHHGIVGTALKLFGQS